MLFNRQYGLDKAVINGTKNMTRRDEKAVRKTISQYCEKYGEFLFPKESQYFDSGYNRLVIRATKEPVYIKTRYVPGEIVAVAQRYGDDDVCNYLAPTNTEKDAYTIGALMHSKGWDNSMFVKAKLMPHRIKITDVRLERLQDISDEDCMSEGIQKKSNFPRKKSLPFYFKGGKHEWDNSFRTPRKAFAALIDKVSGKGTWISNPYVVVYSFELIK